jgi:hypothetical protein
MDDVAREALAERVGGTPLEQMQSAYAGLTVAVKRLMDVYDMLRDAAPDLNGGDLPGPVQTHRVIPMDMTEWFVMLRDHDDGFANAVQDEKDIAAGREPSGTAAWNAYQRHESLDITG